MLWLGKERRLVETGVLGRDASLRLLWEPSALILTKGRLFLAKIFIAVAIKM